MEIKLNGKQETIESNLTLANLLQQNGIKNIEMVTIQLNGNFVNKEGLNSQTLSENDEVDFLYFMGGGSHSYSRNQQNRCCQF